MIRIALFVFLLLQSTSYGQGLFDWMGQQPAKSVAVDPTGTMENADLYALRPVGKHAYIVAVCSPEALTLWPIRLDVESQGWGVVRIEPKIKRTTAFVVIGERITALRNLPTNDDLHRIVSKPSEAARAGTKTMTITMFTANGFPCGWCDKWEREERAKAEAAGAIVLVVPELDNRKPVPHFQVCGADGYCREFSRFTTFEGMTR